MAAIAKKAGAGIRDDDILVEGTAPGLQDEDNAGVAPEGIARRDAGKGAAVGASKVPAKAAAPAAAGAAGDA